MTRYVSVDESGRITMTTPYREYANPGSVEIDFPEGFDFDRQDEYRVVDGELVHDALPPSEEERAAGEEAERRAQMEAATLMLVRTAALTDEQALTVPLLFEDWAEGVAYAQGDIRRHDGKLWRCAQAHTSQADWEPGEAPALWVEVAEPGTVPEWRQPTGAHDAYAKGDRVAHGGKTWESDADANVWEPGVYGWHEVK